METKNDLRTFMIALLTSVIVIRIVPFRNGTLQTLLPQQCILLPEKLSHDDRVSRSRDSLPGFYCAAV